MNRGFPKSTLDWSEISISFNDLQEIQEVMERISKLYRELKSKYLAENKDGAWAYHRVRIFEASLMRLREDGQLMNMNTATLIHLFFDGDFDRFQTELKEFIEGISWTAEIKI